MKLVVSILIFIASTVNTQENGVIPFMNTVSLQQRQPPRNPIGPTTYFNTLPFFKSSNETFRTNRFGSDTSTQGIVQQRNPNMTNISSSFVGRDGQMYTVTYSAGAISIQPQTTASNQTSSTDETEAPKIFITHYFNQNSDGYRY